jgi:hypothetical protein
MNLLYQPENPQAILARCKIKPWSYDDSPAHKDRKTAIRDSKTSFDAFMEDHRGATHHEKAMYLKLKSLPDEPFDLSQAAKVLVFVDDKTESTRAADNRMQSLRNKGLLKATQCRKPIMFAKTQLALDFMAKMKPIMENWEKCKHKKTR